jgi:hypothetical protein
MLFIVEVPVAARTSLCTYNSRQNSYASAMYAASTMHFSTLLQARASISTADYLRIHIRLYVLITKYVCAIVNWCWRPTANYLHIHAHV